MTPQNSFHATAPVNQFQATQYGGADFGAAIRQAMMQQSGNYDATHRLAQALEMQTQGQGPSVAQDQFRQATDQNQNMAAGLLASQRGQNAGLAARQIEQQRAGIQQQGAQQMGLLRSNEILGSQGALGNLYGQMGQQNLGMFGMAGQLGSQNYNAAQSLNANVAGQNANLESHAQDVNAGVASENAANQTKITGGILQGAGSAAAAAAGGGAPAPAAHGALVLGQPRVPGDSSANDTVPILASPGEVVLPRSVVNDPDAPARAADFIRELQKRKMAQGGLAGMAAGGQVPPSGFGKVLALTREHEKRIKLLEARLMTGRESRKIDKWAGAQK